MQKTNRSAGFTLIEVALAIVIGVVIVAGATVLYQQVRVQAGNSSAKERGQALASVAEEYAANTGGYPNVPGIDAAWKLKHPDDYAANPWGGTVQTYTLGPNSYFIDGQATVPSFTQLGDGDTAPTLYSGKPAATAADRGRFYYFICNVQSQPIFIDDFSTMVASGTPNKILGYVIAYVGPNGEHWWMPTAHSIQTGVSNTQVQGQVGG